MATLFERLVPLGARDRGHHCTFKVARVGRLATDYDVYMLVVRLVQLAAHELL